LEALFGRAALDFEQTLVVGRSQNPGPAFYAELTVEPRPYLIEFRHGYGDTPLEALLGLAERLEEEQA
jgi:hypothetical protein